MKNQPALVALTIGLVLFSIISFITQLFLLSHAPDVELQSVGRISSTGVSTFCFNTPPTLNNPCNTSALEDEVYACTLTANDTLGTNFTFFRAFLSPEAILNVSPNGTINFTPTNDDVGTHSMIFFVDDESACSNAIANATFNLTVINVNDAPVLVANISDEEFTVNTTLSAFFLVNYFEDPDGDVLTFTSSEPDGITVTILPSSEVQFSSSICNEEGELVTFTAADPYGLNTSSNAMTVKVKCQTTSSGGDDSDSGGGGGGGGGAVRACESEWECDDWFACLPNGYQWRRCYDRNGCEPQDYLKRHCDYEGPAPTCKENWLCADWQACLPNGTQIRTCTDLAACGSSVVLPPLSQECAYVATCNDGIKNGNETGVDCGGVCGACALVQQPTLITAQASLFAWILALIIIAILLVTGVARYYRAEIARAIATLGFMLQHRAYKEILLDAPQRHSLFERIKAFERIVAEHKLAPSAMYDALGLLIREFTKDALNVPTEALPEEVAARCVKFGLRKETTMLLTGLFAKLPVIEQEDIIDDPLFLLATLEELRTAVCLTSEYAQPEIVRPMQDVEITEKMSFYDEIFARTVNVLRAIQFDQQDIAQKEYLQLLSRYDPLSPEEKEQIYPELRWLFDTVKFHSEITGAKVVDKGLVAA